MNMWQAVTNGVRSSLAAVPTGLLPSYVRTHISFPVSWRWDSHMRISHPLPTSDFICVAMSEKSCKL